MIIQRHGKRDKMRASKTKELFVVSEPVRKPSQKPESFSPKKPEILKMAEEAQNNELQLIDPKTGLMSFEVVKGGPYRFVGKAVYARAFDGRGSKDIFRATWDSCDWVFEELDKLKEHASDEPHDAALLSWNHYTDKSNEVFKLVYGKTDLLGYTVGRFMKADCPVPKDMDYVDIPEFHIAKGWFKKDYSKRGYPDEGVDAPIHKRVEREGVYEVTTWRYMAEIYPDASNDRSAPDFGYYIAARPISEEKRKAAEDSKKLRDVFIEQMNNLAPRGEAVNIDLTTMVKQGLENFEAGLGLRYENGLMVITEINKASRMATPREFKAPLKIELRAKTDSTNIRLHYSIGRLILNFHDFHIDEELDRLVINDILTGDQCGIEGCGEVPINEFVDIEWLIGKEFMAVKVNGEIRHIGNNHDYIREFAKNAEYAPSATVRVAAAFGSTVTVELLRVTEI